MNGYSIDTSGTTGYSNKQSIMMGLKHTTGIKSGFYLDNNTKRKLENNENSKKSGFLEGLIAFLLLKI